MITYDATHCNLSMNQQIGKLFLHRQYAVKLSHLLIFHDDNEWIPHSVYLNKYLAEYQMNKLSKEYKKMMIIPVEFYALKVKI